MLIPESVMVVVHRCFPYMGMFIQELHVYLRELYITIGCI